VTISLKTDIFNISPIGDIPTSIRWMQNHRTDHPAPSGELMGPAPLPLDASIVRTLEGVSTATITTVLLKKGLRNVWLRGTRPLN
jgi:hypothetical protein